MVFDDDEGYSHFQFFWYALYFADRTKHGAGWLKTEEMLRQRFAAVSHATPDGIGRVLDMPCEIAFSADERTVLMDRLRSPIWQATATPHVAAALKALVRSK